MCEEEKAEWKKQMLMCWKGQLLQQMVLHTSLKMVLLLLRTKHWGLFWYGHECMQGKDDVIEEELYAGTAKSMEGILAGECYKQAKEEGFHVDTLGKIEIPVLLSPSLNTTPTLLNCVCMQHACSIHASCMKMVLHACTLNCMFGESLHACRGFIK